MFKVRSIVLLLVALLSETGRGAAHRPITVNEAQELVRALLKPDGWTKLRGFVLYQALFDAEFQDSLLHPRRMRQTSGGHRSLRGRNNRRAKFGIG